MPYGKPQGEKMKINFKGAAMALAFAAATLGSAVTANAAAGISFDIGNVAVGYSDGYMGNDHQYHRWAHASDASRFRAAHKDQYHGYKHNDTRHHDN
jgi:hypothetical protein